MPALVLRRGYTYCTYHRERSNRFEISASDCKVRGDRRCNYYKVSERDLRARHARRVVHQRAPRASPRVTGVQMRNARAILRLRNSFHRTSLYRLCCVRKHGPYRSLRTRTTEKERKRGTACLNSAYGTDSPR